MGDDETADRTGDETGDGTGAEAEVTQAPATWENVVVGEAKETLGHLLRDEELVEEGEEQISVAHKVREEFDSERET